MKCKYPTKSKPKISFYLWRWGDITIKAGVWKGIWYLLNLPITVLISVILLALRNFYVSIVKLILKENKGC